MNYLHNGAVVEHPGPDMSVLPSGLSGAYETLLVREGEPVFWSDHWRRFELGLRAHDCAAPFSAGALRRHADVIAADNGIRDGVLRYAVWREIGGAVAWRVEVSGPRPAMLLREFQVTWGPAVEAAGPDRAFKHLNRTAWAAAVRQAQANGFDQPLLTDRGGHLVEAGTSNVFVVRRGELHTPALECGPLPGVLRAHVIAIARDAGVPVSERLITRPEVGAADELWLTNSLVGIRPVLALDHHHFGRERPVLERIRAAWQARHGWDPVG